MKTTLLAITGALALATGVFAAQPTPLNERQARPSPVWVTRGVMYQIQPRAFTPEGTLKAATERLPKLAGLGVDIIYLCPVFVADDDPNIQGRSPRQKKTRMNNPRNPYRMKDYYHVDPEYGTDDDLKTFIAEAHMLGMRVLLDEEILSVLYLSDRATKVRITFPEPTSGSWHILNAIAEAAKIETDHRGLQPNVAGFGYLIAKRK